MVSEQMDFISSVNDINEYQAEYNILAAFYKKLQNKSFLFELENLDNIIKDMNLVIDYINRNYKSFNLKKFKLDLNSELSETIIACSLLKDDEILNMAIEFSRNNSSYVLVYTKSKFVLFHNGVFDTNFNNAFEDRMSILELKRRRKNIDQLELVFENFHVERKHLGCSFVNNGKIKDETSEQLLRNELIQYLKKETNLNVVPEFCTSVIEDEESVDIGIIDSDNNIAIVEVKFFVKKGYFVSPEKSAYSQIRFKKGFFQLNRYCEHMDKDNNRLHSAFLYMFYAHDLSDDEVNNIANKIFDDFISGKYDEECNEIFKSNFKNTICDNMLDMCI